MKRTPLCRLAVFCWLGSTSCTGVIGNGNDSGRDGATSGTGAGSGTILGPGTNPGSGSGSSPGNADPSHPTGAPPDPKAAGILPLRHLTAREYLNTVRDLVADTSLELGDVPGEADYTANNSFPFRQPSDIGTSDAQALELAAEQVAQNLAHKVASLLPCNPTQASAEASCAKQFISTFGAKIYRRPLTTAEAADLQALYESGRSTLSLDFEGSIDLLLEAMLQSPGFLYHWELDPGPSRKEGDVVQLGNYQIANRLSYFLWGSMPDAALFAAAAAGELTTAAGVEKQARRLLQDPKAKDTLADFFDDWLDINTLATRPKDPAVYPQWNQTLASDMENEFRSFASGTVLGSGSFSELLTGTQSAVTQSLAAVYGIDGVAGTTPQAVTFDAKQRAGLFTLAGFLTVAAAADGSSPVRRGHTIYERMLCQTLPNPPANVPPPAPPTPGQTTRQRFTTHDQNACTGGCHRVMDPIGFGFENYDGLGQYRTHDQDLPIDASGSVTLDGKTQTFSNGLELAKLLAGSAEVQNCFTTQWLRYALNRWDSADDAASIQAGMNAFTNTQLDMREMLLALTTSRTFRYRTPDSGEVLQ